MWFSGWTCLWSVYIPGKMKGFCRILQPQGLAQRQNGNDCSWSPYCFVTPSLTLCCDTSVGACGAGSTGVGTLLGDSSQPTWSNVLQKQSILCSRMYVTAQNNSVIISNLYLANGLKTKSLHHQWLEACVSTSQWLEARVSTSPMA